MTAPTVVRPPAVAGFFYPDDPDDLAATVDACLRAGAAVLADRPPASGPVKALIVPHAGYRYSGDVAGTAYATVAGRDDVRRVVLLGPAHRVAVRGMAVPAVDAFATPLGSVPVDAGARTAARAASPDVVVDDRPHAPEHSLEVHLPFLQRALGVDGWSVLPIVVGPTSAEAVADVLDAVWGGGETLIVVSSDLSHYHDDATAKRLDAATAARIVACEGADLGGQDACGAYPVRGVLEAARRHHLDVTLLDLRTSGDTSGDRSRVVGYGSFALTSASATTTAHLDDAARRALVDLARHVVEEGVAGRVVRGVEPPEGPVVGRASSPALTGPGASFVTLRHRGRLLGCIGTIEPCRPLVEDVAHNAWRAAFADPRLPAVTTDELIELEVKVSVLGPLRPMAVRALAELAAALRPGVDGVLIEGGGRRATFLPSVWQQVASTEQFLDHLWHKASLPPGRWPKDLTVWRYETIEFGD